MLAGEMRNTAHPDKRLRQSAAGAIISRRNTLPESQPVQESL